MRMIRLGRDGPEVSELGLGCMGMSGGYGPADDAETVATIHAALDAGITLLGTADFHGAGHNEMLLREALKGGDRWRAIGAAAPTRAVAGTRCLPAVLARVDSDHSH
jgi:aryl-alcohol dehydrogenase-like predicted oxidoreductase